MIKDYTGALIFGSHDRYLVKQIASSVLVFDNGNVDYYPFGYEHYLEQTAKKFADEEQLYSILLLSTWPLFFWGEPLVLT
jgi:ATP-binding cassette subfamily F protein 3